MVRVLVVDFETTGKDTDKDRITEIGAVLYDPIEKVEMAAIEWLMWDESYGLLSEEGQRVTGLNDTILKREGKPPLETLIKLQETIKGVDYVVAFNKKFDESIFISECNRHSLTVPRTPWVCSLFEYPYPKHLRGRYLKLMYLALEHGIAVDPAKLHRALADCRLLVQIMDKYKWSEVEEYYKTPTIKLIAHTIPPWKDDGVSKDKAKAAGFKWDGIELRWWMYLKTTELDEFWKSYGGAFDVIEPEEKDVP